MHLEPRSIATTRQTPCALPPNILERIIRNGTEEQRDWALGTLSLDTTNRMVRLQTAQIAAALPRRRPRPVPASPSARRTIADAQSTETLPGKTVRTEGQASVSDVAVNEAYDGLGATFDFYSAVFHRDSIDDEGLALLATVHYGDHYDNAFWNGEQMVFGDGDGELFNRFTISLDVIGHELTHGVTEDEAGLAYLNQAGALNESVSDVFGSLVKQYKLGQKAGDADWLIGEGLLAPGVQGVALRSMKAPGTAFDDPVLGKDDQPANMSGYVRTTSDNGGVHTNSGIPNKAFYNAAIAFGGHAWEKAGKIWYETLRSPQLRTNASFVAFANLTVTQARTLFDADAVRAVQDAWRAVGVKI
ncbi:M4 family metallopeptidase [Pseudofrankia asymbiotica]|uniref:M4 family metallopeptidase n=1 Tax=Pseudofrankia asymbiotica TaxID=1834516 RepID=UPI00097724FF|nr:M4 family metallopeptidase [Pseudofrankia asymbiotica]